MIAPLPTDGRTAFCALVVHPDVKARRMCLGEWNQRHKVFLARLIENAVGLIVGHDRLRLKDSLRLGCNRP